MRAPLTPIKAFVQDAAKRGLAGDESSAEDPRLSQWLLVAQAAERLAELKPPQRAEYVKMLGTSVLPARSGRPTQIEGDGRGPTDAVALLAERLRLEAEDMERAGCFELALTTVSSVCQMLARGSLTARLLATAHLGRVARQIGELNAAVDCYTTVTTEGQRVSDGPVAAHGFIGLGNVAHSRGNRPSQKTFFLKALELAAEGSPVELSAHQGLLITANQQGELAEALLHGWRAHDLAPPDSQAQHETLINLANTALQAGFHTAALAGFDYVIQRTTETRNRLMSIGGGIQAAARIPSRDQVEDFERLGQAEAKLAAAPYDVARFYFWAAEARRMLHDEHLVGPLVRQSLALADAHGFHELRLRAENLLESKRAGETAPTPLSQSVKQFSDPIVEKGIGRLRALATV